MSAPASVWAERSDPHHDVENYWVDVRRTIDGKNYKCSTTGIDAKQAAAVLAACKSLKK